MTDDGALLVRVRAAPVDGAANAAVERLLADLLGVPRSAVAIERGRASRSKLFRADVPSKAITDAWPGLRIR